MEGKMSIVTIDEMARIKAYADRRKVGVCFTYGSFDLLHPGHIEHFRYCRELIGPKGILVVGVRNDFATKELKGKDRPVWDENTRLAAVAAIEEVDFAILASETEEGGVIGHELLVKLRPNICVISPDCRLMQIKVAICKAIGAKVVLTPRDPPDGHPEISTTRLISEAAELACPLDFPAEDEGVLCKFLQINT
jgi:cytidyltransferase-like protein